MILKYENIELNVSEEEVRFALVGIIKNKFFSDCNEMVELNINRFLKSNLCLQLYLSEVFRKDLEDYFESEVEDFGEEQ